MTEKTVETKTCTMCGSQFDITDQDLTFYDKMSPNFDKKKYKIPTPTLCPRCRTQRRLSYRNDRSLYKTECALTGKSMFSMYNPNSGYAVYEQSTWRSDDWDPMKYAQEVDFSKPFFEQYAELMQRVPRFNLFNLDTENCNFVNYAPHCKSCYLLFGSWFCQDCYYGQTMNECKNCIDNIYVDKSEYCYENVDCNDNYNSFFCQNSANLTNSYFCFDCENLTNCIGCYNLRNKQYHILNKPVSKEEFEEEKKKFSSYAYLAEKKDFYNNYIKDNAIFREYRGLNNENVSGDFIFDSKNIKHCFSVYRSENLAYCARMFEGKNSYDFDGGGKSELTYENMSNDFSYFCIGCTTSEHLTYSLYCDLCFNCDYCFGCVGLRKKQYCIFNKQYTKQEYEKLVPKIIEHMQSTGERGEFIDGQYTPFGYNETMAYEYYPLSQQEAEKMGYIWKIEQENKEVGQRYQIPDNISEVRDDILDQVLQCEVSKKKFKIIPQELNFYKKVNLPIPRLHPDMRHQNRLEKRTPRKLREKNCDKCGTKMQTAYAPERTEKVYCEKCYKEAVY